MSPDYHNDVAPKCALRCPDDCARQGEGLIRENVYLLVIWVATDAHFRVQERKFDRLLTDVVVLRLSQATEQEVGGRRTETE